MKKLCFVALLAALLLPVPFTIAQTGSPGSVMITGSLANFDVRYPLPQFGPLPNDLEIVIYGDGLVPADVVGTYPNPQWGQASSITGGINSDPTSPAFGLDCVIIRYTGAQLPNLAGQLRHFGVRLRIGAAVAHQEVWWTFNGQRINRPAGPHVTWICTSRGWLVCIQNPNPFNIYIYGMRHFLLGPAAPLPLLVQLTTNIQPQQFGATDWTFDPLPGGVRVLCIPPWCRIYIRVVVTRWRPFVWQAGVRNVDENTFPLQGDAMAPNPNDFNPQTGDGTQIIFTGRATEDLGGIGDITGNGSINASDVSAVKINAGVASGDLGQTQ
jgi:hypothetical protein